MLDFDQSLIGREFEAESPVEVTAEMIANFRFAIGDIVGGGDESAKSADASSDDLVARVRWCSW
jgi:hypothetical protein